MVKEPFYRFFVYGTKFKIEKINLDKRWPGGLSKNGTNAKKTFKN
jgi:hypothetical protein